MAAKQILSTFIQQNANFAKTYQGVPPLSAIRAKLAAGGGGPKGTVILACSDPRLTPETFLGMQPGQGAIIRNAGGRAMDAMRSIHVLNTLGPLATIIVIHHTDCGTTHVHDDVVRENMKKNGSTIDAAELEATKFGEILDLEKSINEDVALIKNDPGFGNRVPEVVGLLYTVETGLLKQVV